MRKERKSLPLDGIALNEGQLDWLPRNPRSWTQSEIDKTAASIREDTDFLEDRPLLVTPSGDKFVVFAGNLRREGAAATKLTAVPAVVYYPEAADDYATIKRRAMKDNGSFGSWDYDELANSWDDLPLVDWGVPAWPEQKGPEDYGEDFSLQDGEKAPFQQMAFTLADEQARLVKDALSEAKSLEEYKSQITYGNENGNGNALSLIIEQWLAQRT